MENPYMITITCADPVIGEQTGHQDETISCEGYILLATIDATTAASIVCGCGNTPSGRNVARSLQQINPELARTVAISVILDEFFGSQDDELESADCQNVQ